jgi:hypothetical protein
MSEATSDGKRLIDAWVGAQERERLAQSELNSARCEVSNSQRALAKWMLPDDAKVGEKIAVWHGDSLIQVEMLSHGDAVVSVRTRGRKGVTGDFRG